MGNAAVKKGDPENGLLLDILSMNVLKICKTDDGPRWVKMGVAKCLLLRCH